MSYEFAGSLYPTAYRAAEAIVDHFMSAGGLNSREQIVAILDGMTDLQLCDELVAEWEMPEGVDQETLMEAFASYRMEVETPDDE